MKFSAKILHKELLSKSGFLDNWDSEGHTVLTNVKEFLQELPSFLY